MSKTYFWHDALNDDFANTNINTVNVSDNYKYYSRNPIYIFFETLIRIVALPIIWIILKVMFMFSVKNKKVIKNSKGKGYFIYSIHTNYLLDAYSPSVVAFPKKAHIIVNPDAVSIKGLATVVKMLGAIPIPSSIKGLVRFKRAIYKLTEYKRVIAIYPEAHIWPYYTDIRPFGNQSFLYPVETNLPSFVATNIYVKRKISIIKAPKVITYIDGPFYPDSSLPKADRVKKLRDDVYNAMKKRVDENPKYNYCNYVYVEDENETNKK